MMQDGDGVRGPIVAPSGATIQVEVGPNDTSVEVHTSGQGDTTKYQVPPNKSVSVTIPPSPPGTLVSICIGTGFRRRRIYVEVVALIH